MFLVDSEVAGNPSNDQQWVRRSLRKLRRALQAYGLDLSPGTIQRVLHAYGIRSKGNVKHLMPRAHPDRDRQFRHIVEVRTRFTGVSARAHLQQGAQDGLQQRRQPR